MVTIHEVLNRIRRDEEIGRGEFVIGYDDHVTDRIIRVSFHRIRDADKDGALIRQRHPPH